MLTSNGRLIPNGSAFDREYFLTDHLGNTRVIFIKSGDMAAIVQENPVANNPSPALPFEKGRVTDA
jgi:hypothetical protein